MRINPAWRVTFHAPDRVVLGSGTGAVELTHLDDEDARMLRALATGSHAGPVPRPLGRLIEPALVPPGPPRPSPVPGMAAHRLRMDALHWDTAYGPHDDEPLERRWKSTVWISGLDRCGMAVAFALAAAGTGRFAVRDDAPVAPEDLGTTPLRLPELGLSRGQALSRHLERLHPHTHVLAPVPLPEAVRGADAAVIVARDGLSEEDADRLARAAVPVLPVVFHESGFRLGPLHHPDAPGCAACRTDAWPRLPRGERWGGPLAPPETTSALVAAALAAQSVAMVLDGVNLPACADGAFVGTLGSGAVYFEPLPAGCRHRAVA